MSKKVGIICYGTEEDRERLAALSKAHGKTGSSWMIAQIRKEYEKLFGDLKLGRN